MNNSNFPTDGFVSCEQFRLLIDDFIEGELRPSLSADMELHSVSCAECARAYSETKQLLAVARSLRDLPIPQGVHVRLMAALQNRLSKDPLPE